MRNPDGVFFNGWGITVNCAKGKTEYMVNGQSYLPQPQRREVVLIQNNVVHKTDTYKHMGLKIEARDDPYKMDTSHAEASISKVQKGIGRLRQWRLLRSPTSDPSVGSQWTPKRARIFLMTYVLPKFDYGSAVWSYTPKQMRKLESIWEGAIRCALGLPKWATINLVMHDMDLPTIAMRKRHHILTMWQSIIRNYQPDAFVDESSTIPAGKGRVIAAHLFLWRLEAYQNALYSDNKRLAKGMWMAQLEEALRKVFGDDITEGEVAVTRRPQDEFIQKLHDMNRVARTENIRKRLYKKWQNASGWQHTMFANMHHQVKDTPNQLDGYLSTTEAQSRRLLLLIRSDALPTQENERVANYRINRASTICQICKAAEDSPFHLFCVCPVMYSIRIKYSTRPTIPKAEALKQFYGPTERWFRRMVGKMWKRRCKLAPEIKSSITYPGWPCRNDGM